MHRFSSPALNQAWEQFEERRNVRRVFQVFGVPDAQTKRHKAPLKLAYVRSGKFYLLMRYCEGCQRGYVLDLVRDIPDNTVHAHAEGVTLTSEWSVDCTA